MLTVQVTDARKEPAVWDPHCATVTENMTKQGNNICTSEL